MLYFCRRVIFNVTVTGMLLQIYIIKTTGKTCFYVEQIWIYFCFRHLFFFFFFFFLFCPPTDQLPHSVSVLYIPFKSLSCSSTCDLSRKADASECVFKSSRDRSDATTSCFCGANSRSKCGFRERRETLTLFQKFKKRSFCSISKKNKTKHVEALTNFPFQNRLEFLLPCTQNLSRLYFVLTAAVVTRR